MPPLRPASYQGIFGPTVSDAQALGPARKIARIFVECKNECERNKDSAG